VTTIFPEQVRCPECGHEHVVCLLGSTNNFAAAEPTFVYRGYARCPLVRAQGTDARGDRVALRRS
jgi:hypothetical protein